MVMSAFTPHPSSAATMRLLRWNAIGMVGLGVVLVLDRWYGFAALCAGLGVFTISLIYAQRRHRLSFDALSSYLFVTLCSGFAFLLAFLFQGDLVWSAGMVLSIAMSLVRLRRMASASFDETSDLTPADKPRR